jgi:hypothetical protein
MIATHEPNRSPATGIVPGPVHVDEAPTSASKQPDGPTLERRNPLRRAAARVMSSVRGDKYMVDAYPAARHEDGATPDDTGPRAAER